MDTITEQSITEYITLINTNEKVIFKTNDEWIEANVIGIDVEEDMLKLQTKSEDGSKKSFWFKLYFQLNSNFPKEYKVKKIYTKGQLIRFHVYGQRLEGLYVSMIDDKVIKIEVTYDSSDGTDIGCTANVHESFMI